MKSVKKLLGVFAFMMVAILCVPNSVKAAEMSAEFKAYLNEDEMFEFNSVVPTDEEYFALMVERVTYDEDYNWNGLQFTNVANDYSEVDLTINCDESNEETHRVKLQWNYDKTANSKIQNFMNTTLKNKTEFSVKDLELVNYWNNLIKNNYKAELIMFSGELKTALNYVNIEFDVSTRGGGGAPFKSETIGFAYFGYSGSTYHVINGFGATADHILYVPTETENTAEAIQVAAQKRINDYLGETDIEVSYISTAKEYWISYFYQEMRDVWMLDNPSLTLEQFAQTGNIYMPPYPSFEEGFEIELGLAGVSENDLVYSIDIPIDENMGDSKYAIIRRDSSKMVNPVSKTADLSTDIEISSSATLPLDTIIQAKELTSGAEYERILKILNLTDNLTFDLKLYSDSTDKYITELADGTFEVKIPIPKDFKGKDLVVYYVNENGEKEEYNVTVKDGYAIFKTTHFSIYTLGYTAETNEIIIDFTKIASNNDYIFTELEADMLTFLIDEKGLLIIDEEERAFKDKNGKILFTVDENDNIIFAEGLTTDDNIIHTFTEEEKAELKENGINLSKISIIFSTEKPKTEEIEENPKTFDSIGCSIFMGTISLIGLAGATIYLKKRNKINAN